MATAALTNTPTSIDDAESTTNWTGDTFALEPDIKVEGNNSVATVITPNAGSSQEIYVAGTWDFSTTDQHIRLWANISFGGDLQTEANNGWQIFISDGTNTSYWTVSGSDAYAGGWKQFVIYTGDTPTEDSGTPATKSTLTRIGMRFKTLTKPRNVPANAWFDAWAYGDGYTITGGTSGDELDWSHIASVDNTSAYGIVSEVDGVYFLAGEITIGDGISTTYFAPASQLAMFKDLAVLSTLYQIIFFDDASALTNIDISGGAWSAAGTQRFLLDASETTINSFAIDGLQMSRGADGSSFHAGASVTNTVFNDCLQVDPSTATFTDNNFTNSVATDGALYWNGSSNTNNCNFIICDKGVEVTQATNQTFTNMTFDDEAGNFDVHLNNGGTDIDISKTGTSNPNSYTTTGGGVITFVGSSVTIKATALDTAGDPIQSAQVLLRASDGTGDFPYDETVTIVNSGTTATVTHATHGMASADYIQITGASLAANNGVFSITVTGVGTYTYTMLSTPGSSPTGTIKATFVALYGVTDVNGEKSATRVYNTTQPVEGWIRKSTTSPFYKQGILVGEVSTTLGYDKTGVMVLDE